MTGEKATIAVPISRHAESTPISTLRAAGEYFAWQLPSRHLELRLWARNVLDERCLVFNGSSTTGEALADAPPRTYGVTLTARYCDGVDGFRASAPLTAKPFGAKVCGAWE